MNPSDPVIGAIPFRQATTLESLLPIAGVHTVGIRIDVGIKLETLNSVCGILRVFHNVVDAGFCF